MHVHRVHIGPGIDQRLETNEAGAPGSDVKHVVAAELKERISASLQKQADHLCLPFACCNM